MELKYYWRVLARRRNIIRNTFLIVAVIGLLSVAYSYYGDQYQGTTTIGVQVQPNKINNPSIDTQAAAYGNTDQVIDDLDNYAGTITYFKAVSARLKSAYHINKDYKAISQGLKVFKSSQGHSIYIEWPGTNSTQVTNIVAAAEEALRSYVLVYHSTLNPGMSIKTAVTENPTYKRTSLSSMAIQFLLRAALGLVAGIILAYLFEYLDDSIQDESDVRHWMNLPTLAVIPGGQPARRTRSA